MSKNATTLTVVLEGLLGSGPVPTDVFLDYTPKAASRDAWDSVREHVLTTVATMQPAGVPIARKYLQCYSALCLWANTQGMAISHPSLLTEGSLRRFVNARYGSSNRSTASTNLGILRAIGRQANPNGGWPAKNTGVASGRAIKGPYEAEHLEKMWAALEAAPDDVRTRQLMAIVLLGLACGPQPLDYKFITASSITKDGNGVVWVRLSGVVPRVVPAAQPWADRLLTLSRTPGPLLPTPDSKNSLNEFIVRNCRRLWLPPVSLGQLRTTWMVDRLRAGVDIQVLLLDYAGLRTLHNALELLPYLTKPEAGSQVETMTADVRRG